MNWRLALDMGTNSLGWAAFQINKNGQPVALLDAGVRIFSDGREPSKSGRVGDSLAVNRRDARGMRKTRDRRINRKKQVMKFLIKHGLMPADVASRRALEILNPYEQRARAVTENLSTNELGRALFQISQRRGFKSNRQTDGDEESGKIKPKMSALRHLLQETEQTLGQWMWQRYQDGDSLRFRADDDSDYYPDRQMYLDEFDKIRAKQEPVHSLSPSAWDELRDYHIFYQRPLKPVERGKCEFFIKEQRAHKDLPIAHEFRIYQEVNNLLWIDENRDKRELTVEQRDRIVSELQYNKKTMKFSTIAKLKDENKQRLFPVGIKFNLETEARDKLLGNATAIDMRDDKFLGQKWDRLTCVVQNTIIEKLHEAKDNAEIVDQLTAPDIGLTKEEALGLCGFKLSSATGQVSRKFMERIIPIMRDEHMKYDAAVREVYDDDGVLLHHSNRRINNEELLDKLPYYGEILRGSVIGGKPNEYDPTINPEQYFGKINNPTVHVALNQLRKLVNRLAERFGMPTQVHVELTRDLKKTSKARNEIAKINAKNAKENDRRKQDIEALPEVQQATGLDIKRMKLWEELNGDGLPRTCVFCGKAISASQLFNGEAEIEHILPFSRTLDNSMANLTMAHRECNRKKGNRTPFEAFGSGLHASEGYIWTEICDRVASLPSHKQWRFDADAIHKFDENGGFIARQLHDNAYISRITKRYLAHVCPENKIVSIPGQLTAMMRGMWHLNGLIGNMDHKERTDHRHHVIDAFVAGLTDRSLLNQVSKDTARGVDAQERIKLPDITALRTQLEGRLKSMVVSFKPDHGSNGKMYAETAYGYIKPEGRDPDKPDYTLVTRRDITSLSKIKQIEEIRCPTLRTQVLDYVYKAQQDGMKLDKALAAFSKETGVKRVRTLVKNQSATPIESAPYKYYAPDAYVCVDIWAVPKGKKGKWKKGEVNWQGYFWPYRDCGPNGVPSPEEGRQLSHQSENQTDHIHPGAKFVMRLFKNDMVELSKDCDEKIMQIKGFSTTNNKLDLKQHTDATTGQNFVSINVLKNQNMQKITIHEDGSLG